MNEVANVLQSLLNVVNGFTVVIPDLVMAYKDRTKSYRERTQFLLKLTGNGQALPIVCDIAEVENEEETPEA